MSVHVPSSILVIDDDALVLGVACVILTRSGMQAVSCTNAFEAAEHMKQTKFDLILTDYTMPVADGSVVVESATLLAPNTPVMIMTGNASVVKPSLLTGQRPVQVLLKPFNAHQLVSTVRAVLEAGARHAVS